uniref:efflux RND transporter permease subunit n=1 Tax=Roseivirga sp. TaxID=1964215 RepID=UPI004055D02D
MLDNIIKFSIKNKLIIGLFTLALIGWGGYSLTKLPIDAVPDITDNQVMVITVSPTLAAQEVEQLVTFPVEQTMVTIPEIKEMRSFSRFGLSIVTIVFEESTDLYWARQQVQERLSLAGKEIPEGVGQPEMAPVTTGLGEIYQYVVRPEPGFEDQYDATELRTIQDWIIKRQLLGTPGVAEVSGFGGYIKQYEIALNPDKLRSFDIGINEVFEALKTNNQNTGGAYIDKNPNAYFIRSEGLVKNLDEIDKIVVKSNVKGTPVLIRDIASVQFGHSVRYGAATRNAKGEVETGIVMMLKGANSSAVISNVKEKIEQIKTTLPEGVTIEPFLDRKKLVDSAISTVVKNLAEGALIVIFILILFLGNLRGGFVVASVIPLAMLFALGMMRLFGVSGNLMSLGAIDFGLIVDGAVIIVEAVLHGVNTSKKKYAGSAMLTRDQMDHEVFESSSKIRTSAAFGEIIILIVYLPLWALVGVEGKMFTPMAQTVSFAILGAFILSLTYVPMMSALVLSKKTAHKRNFSDKMMDFFQRIYQPVIERAIHKKGLVVGIAVVLFIITLFTFSRMGGEFIPQLDEGDFAVETRVPVGSSLQQSIAVSKKAQEIILREYPEVLQVVNKIGSGEIPTDPMPIEAGDMMIILKPKDEWVSAETREELAEKMQQSLAVIPNATFGFQQPIQMRFNELLTGAKQDVVIKIYGEDLNMLSELADKVGKNIKSIEGVEDLYVEEITGLPQIQIELDRDKIAEYGMNVESINQTIATAFAGKTAGLVYEGERRFDLVVRLDKGHRTDISDVQDLYVDNPNGGAVPLREVANINFEPGPVQIQRDNAKRRVTIGFNVRTRDVQSIVSDIQKVISEKVNMPAGYYVTYGGQFENLQRASERLAIVVPLALLLILVLLYFTFGSVKQSLLIFTAIPLSAIGGVFALIIRDMPFSISAGVGFIALFGVAVLNGIVLVAEFNRLEKSGVSDIYERVLKGTRVRLRPVLMTAAVASLGFLPMALSSTAGAEVQRPLATVVIGGLLTA